MPNWQIVDVTNDATKRGYPVVDGSTGSIAGPTLSTEADFTSAMRYATNAMGASYNGGAVATDTTATIPTGIDRLYVGAGGSGTAQSGTYVARLAWFSASLSDANMQAVQALL